MRPPLSAPSPPSAIAPMTAPPAAAPPAIFASLPALDPAVRSNPVASMRKVFPSAWTRSNETTRRALPCTRPERTAETTWPLTSEPAGRSTSPSTTTSSASSATTRSSGFAVFVVRADLSTIGRAVPAATTRGRGVGVGSGVGTGVGAGLAGSAAKGPGAAGVGSTGSGRDAVAGEAVGGGTASAGAPGVQAGAAAWAGVAGVAVAAGAVASAVRSGAACFWQAARPRARARAGMRARDGRFMRTSEPPL